MQAVEARTKRSRRFIRYGIVVGLVALGWWCAWGPLFAWSPVKPGFASRSDPPIFLYYRELHPPGRGLLSLGEVTRQLESTLGLSFVSEVPVVLCDRWSDLRRFTPWLPVNRQLGARTLPLGHVIYVTPLVRDRDDAVSFVKHELVHVLLHQHMPLLDRLDGGRPAWLIEGLATSFGNPSAYPSGPPFVEALRGRDLRALLEQSPRSASDVALFYAAAGQFVSHLRRTSGDERLRDFVRRYVDEPRAYARAFEETFGTNVARAIAGYAEELEPDLPAVRPRQGP
jgi:hypothetical protein